MSLYINMKNQKKKTLTCTDFVNVDIAFNFILMRKIYNL